MATGYSAEYYQISTKHSRGRKLFPIMHSLCYIINRLEGHLVILFLLFGWPSHPLAALVCVALARRHSYPALGAACAGMLLGWGAVPLTVLATWEPLPALAEPWNPGLNPVERIEQGPRDEWAEWCHFYLDMRQRLTVSTVLLVAVVPLFTLFIVPTGVALFEGGLSPEGSSSTHFFHSPLVIFAVGWFQLAWPALFYWLLVGNYRFPFVGRIWRHADRIWLLQAPELTLPSEVERRTRKHVFTWDEASLISIFQRERAQLQEALKRCPIFRLAELTWALIFGLGLVSLLFPMYQLVGHTGR